VSNTEKQRKSQLECLRLASELEQLAKMTSDPEVQAHCLRMASVWTARATGVQPEDGIDGFASID
jgi:hypothetical protein